MLSGIFQLPSLRFGQMILQRGIESNDYVVLAPSPGALCLRAHLLELHVLHKGGRFSISEYLQFSEVRAVSCKRKLCICVHVIRKSCEEWFQPTHISNLCWLGVRFWQSSKTQNISNGAPIPNLTSLRK